VRELAIELETEDRGYESEPEEEEGEAEEELTIEIPPCGQRRPPMPLKRPSR
jgi:hypothetical protein